MGCPPRKTLTISFVTTACGVASFCFTTIPSSKLSLRRATGPHRQLRKRILQKALRLKRARKKRRRKRKRKEKKKRERKEKLLEQGKRERENERTRTRYIR